MALGTPSLIVSGGTVGASHSSASFTPPLASAPMIMWVVVRRDSGGPANAATFTDSEGGSLANGAWVEIAPSVELTVTGSLRFYLLRKISVASPVPIILTAASTSATGISITGVQISGALFEFANVKVGQNTAGDPAATLDTPPAATSTVLNFFASYGTGGAAMPAGFTQISNSSVTGQIRYAIGYDAGSPTATVAWTTTSTSTFCALLEIKERVDSTVVLDSADIRLAGTDLYTPLLTTVALDGGNLVVGGADLLTPAAVAFDTKGATIVGSDVLAPTVVALDIKGASVAGVDLVISPPVTTALDSKGVAIASSDLLMPTAVALDTKGTSIAGSDLSTPVSVPLDTKVAAIVGRRPPGVGVRPARCRWCWGGRRRRHCIHGHRDRGKGRWDRRRRRRHADGGRP